MCLDMTLNPTPPSGLIHQGPSASQGRRASFVRSDLQGRLAGVEHPLLFLALSLTRHDLRLDALMSHEWAQRHGREGKGQQQAAREEQRRT